VFTPAQTAAILLLLAGWLVSSLLVLANLLFIITLPIGARSRLMHVLLFISYSASTCALFNGGFQSRFGDSLGFLLVFAIPITVIGHFVFSFRTRRKLKRIAEEKEKAATESSPTAVPLDQ
jgi:hypothetical protein